MKISNQEQKLLNDICNVISQNLYHVENFGCFSNDDLSNEVEDLENALEFHFEDIETARGVSKYVIIHPNLNFVIKIPFNGYWYYPDDDTDEEPSFVNFECARAQDSEWDYCAAEVEVYQASQEKNVSNIFAETEQYITIGNFNIYLQEKVISYSEHDNSSLHPSDYAKKHITDNYVGNSNWSAAVIDWYGEIFYRNFLKFIEEDEHEAGRDFHAGNIGFRENEMPVILDFSGYNDF